MSRQDRAGRYSHVKRRTPSAPMAALNPMAVVDGPETPTTMGPRTRDEVLLKALARIERIDTEMEDGVDQRKALLDYQKQTSAQLTDVMGQLQTIKEILADVLTRLPE